MYVTFKIMVHKQWEAVKSPSKIEFYTEPQSQCGICDYAWFKNSESIMVRGRKKSIQNGILHWTQTQCGICEYG